MPNSTTVDLRLGSSGGNVAVLPDGKFFITYQAGLGASSDAYGQLFNSAGTALGGAVALAQNVAGEQIQSKVVALANGDLFVYWVTPLNPSFANVSGRFLHSNGSPATDEFLISSTTPGYSSEPSAIQLQNGDVLVTWANTPLGGAHDVVARTFDLDGGVITGSAASTINTFTTGVQGIPSVAKLADDTLVVTWSSFGQDGSGYGIYGQHLAANGVTPIDGEFHISTATSGDQLRSTVTALSDGGFAVAWEDIAGREVNMQRFTSNAVKVEGEVQVNDNKDTNQRGPDIVGLDDGSFAVAYLSFDIATSEINLRVFDASTKLSGLSVSDIDAGDDPLTVTVIAEHGFMAPADPGVTDTDASAYALSFSGLLTDINSALAQGVIYTPDGTSITDKVTLTVDDGFGGIDVTNFIFAQAATGSVTLTGTPEKDVIYGTGYNDTLAGELGDDVLTGDSGVDTFIFAPGGSGGDHDSIADYETALAEVVDLSAYGFDQTEFDAILLAATTSGGNTTIQLDDDLLTFQGLSAAMVQNNVNFTGIFGST